MSIENWRCVPKWEGLYRVSDLGNVYSIRSKRIIKGGMSKKYRSVNLYINGKYYNRPVHRLVLLAFVGPCPDGMEACHKDGNQLNNRLENLRWDTRENNNLDKSKHGKLKGSNNGRAVFTDEMIRRIRKEYQPGVIGYKRLAKRYNVSRYCIQAIITGRTWSHVK